MFQRKFVLLFLAFLLIQFSGLDAMRCFNCDSDKNENCSTLRNISTIESIECADEFCAIWLDGNRTLRGCKPTTIDEIDESKRILCNTENCNNFVFPRDRLQCVKCEEHDYFCMNPKDTNSFPCKNYSPDDKCYTLIYGENQAIRGCLSDNDDEFTTCEAYDDLCVKCAKSSCNIAVESSAPIQCITCNDDRACGYNPARNAPNEICESSCFSYKNETNFIRGCLSKFPELNSQCEENTEYCQTCDTSFCNDVKLIAEKCVECENCKSTRLMVPTICGKATFDQAGCYLSDKKDVITRGCVTSLTSSQFIECKEGKTCKICHGDMCNSKETFQKCYQCNSTENPNCATLLGKLPEVLCDDYMDTCKTYVKPSSTTHRGCSKMEPTVCTPGLSNCSECKTNLCNGEKFPSNRISCYHCTANSTDSECFGQIKSNSTLSHICETYNFRDSCYLYVDERLRVYRGCLSDQNNSTRDCQLNPSRCRTCQTSNCNYENVIRPPTLSCLSCDTTDGYECLWGLQESTAKKCSEDVYFFEKESCYTMSLAELKFAIRGCTLDTNVCSSPTHRCEFCQGNSCNRFSLVEQYCYNCTSEDNKNCWLEPFHTSNISCPNDVKYETRGCYTWVHENNTIRRGCFSDFTLDQGLGCLKDDESCERCVDEGNCNKTPINQATREKFNLILKSIMTIILIQVFKNN